MRLLSRVILSLAVIHFFWIQIVVGEPVPGYLFPCGARLAVIAVWVNGNTAPGREFPPDFYVFGRHQPNQVFHNNVHAVLMEIPMIAETEQI